MTAIFLSLLVVACSSDEGNDKEEYPLNGTIRVSTLDIWESPEYIEFTESEFRYYTANKDDNFQGTYIYNSPTLSLTFEEQGVKKTYSGTITGNKLTIGNEYFLKKEK